MMHMAMGENLVIGLLIFVVAGIGMSLGALLFGKLVRTKLPHPEKGAAYECGEPTIGQAWIRFDIRFYTVALMFVVFDVEIALLFPWAVVFRDLVQAGQGWIAFLEAGTFIAVLVAGLLYVWARGDMDWTAPGIADPSLAAPLRPGASRMGRAGEEPAAALEGAERAGTR